MKRMILWAMGGVAAMALTAAAEQGAGPGPGKGERFKKADADGDGKLSPTEFAAFSVKGDAAKKFAFADTDKDGFLTPGELKAAKAAHHQKMQGEHPKKDKKNPPAEPAPKA